jgi:superfamily II DNA or RNA helicase
MRNLVSASLTPEALKAIEEYAFSDSEEPPNLSSLSVDEDAEIGTASSEELAQLVSQQDDDEKITTTKQILAQTNLPESISVDEEIMQFLLSYNVLRLWKNVFRDHKNKAHTTIKAVREEGMNGNKFHDECLQNFLSDYEGAMDILSNNPDGYSFTDPKTGKIVSPTLMQGYVAYKIKTQPFFGNFSSVGTGKTLSAILASRVIGSKMTVVVCPNDVVEQWNERIIEAFPDSCVITDRDKAFNAKYDGSKHKYLVLNYDKFSQDNSQALISILVKQKIDLVVLDEVHYTKRRGDDEKRESQRRTNLARLMTYARQKNMAIRVLGMSATPVINDLMEGRSLLELMSGKVYDDIATRPTVHNAANLFAKFSLHSVRQKQKYADIKTNFTDVQATKPDNSTIRQLKAHPLMMEQILTESRIPEIIKNIESKTIIYTEYVTEIVEKLRNAVQAAGHNYGFYTGHRRDDLNKFTNGNIQVLIASKPISVGVDGLQKICNRLIINTLPWTHAQWEQLVGRLGRMGQESEVKVFIIRASIGGFAYDEKIKWNRIVFKRTLGDCAVDGVLPEKNLVTPHQAQLEAINWLERLDRGEISSVNRADLNVYLTPIQIQQRIVKYGDFARLNKQFNNENSALTHKRITDNPEVLVEYHRQFRQEN